MLEMNKIYCMDCIKGMKQLDDDVVDTVIVDVPYGLGFMGREWDTIHKLYEFTKEWSKEALRVAKPGATLLCFGGTRTWHRIACGLEDAGWNIRDTLIWLYGSGFPKAYDISKGIDKKLGAEREVIYGSPKPIEYSGKFDQRSSKNRIKDLPSSKEAQEWNGWKSHGLKPAWEPILMCMKPNDGGYVDNALKWGVSGLNIDDGRILTNDNTSRKITTEKKNLYGKFGEMGTFSPDWKKGRFPSNVILDETAATMLDKQCPETSKGYAEATNGVSKGSGSIFGFGGVNANRYDMGGLGASRFFYVAKASNDERNMGCDNNQHPTIKPLKLMEYLCDLTKTPRGGIVMDCFCGSGTTLMAAKKTGRKWLGFDNCQEYVDIAKSRVGAVVAEPSLEDWGI